MTYDRNEVTSASNAQADELCPGRFQAQRGLQDIVNPDAIFGRELHEALKTNDPSKLSVQQRDTFDTIQRIESGLLAQYFGMDAPNAIKFCYREEPLTIEVGGHLHGATPDVVYRYLCRALVLEYKSLAGAQPSSPRNLQLRDQVVVVRYRFVGLTEVACAVIQPLVTQSPELCVYSEADIERALGELLHRVLKSRAKDPPRVAGQIQCAFCKAKPYCREYQEWVTRHLPVPAGLVRVPVAEWDPMQRKVFCDHKAIAKKWLEDTEKAMKEGVAKDPNFIPGWGLDDGDARRTVKDLQALFERFNQAGGELPQFMACMRLTLGDFEEAVGKVFPSLKGKRLKEKVAQLLEGLVEINRTAPSLVGKEGE